MKPEDVHLDDWKRLLFGTGPAWFPLEVFVRTVVMYVALIVALRILGKRLSGQLSILELAVFITLGGIVSAPMVLEDKGLLIGFVLLLCALTFLRGLGRAGVASRRFERLAHGDVTLLAADGMLLTDALAAASFSKNQLFVELRSRGVRHLGETERVYLEATGTISIFKAETPKPGLAVFPHDARVPRLDVDEAHSACWFCGNVVEKHEDEPPCGRCGKSVWTVAVVRKDEE